jgi:two-component system NtrC family sensor kinase
MAKFEGGDLAARMTVAKEDELGDLAQSFNAMADRLESLNQEIQDHHQEQMKRVEKIATTGELAASVAHEIKNPASGIANAMQIILSELKEDDDRRPIYEEIILQVERMNKAISDLLTYAQPSPPIFEIVDVSKTITAALRFVEPQAQNSGVNVIKKIGPDLPPILADYKQVEQVLINLCINAIQSMPEGGQLTIQCWQDSDDRRVRISVSDTGQGIPLEQQADIFKPFYTTKAKGSGLGLAICRRIMQEHHGRIDLEGESGQGTTFTLTFPSKRGNDIAE